MSDDILDFPTSEYANRIAGMEQWKSLQAVRECFQYAVEKNMGRAPIIKFISSNADLISIYKDEPRRFVEWVADNCVYLGENGLKPTPAQPTGMRERSHANEAYELLLNEVGALGREAAEKGSTPYGWFTA